MKLSRFGLLFLALLIGATCGPRGDDSNQRGTSRDPQAPPDAGRPPASEVPADTMFPFVGTAGIVEKKRPAATVALLRAVRSAPRPGFDRVVFDFAGDSLPGYHVEYIDHPVRQCASGDVVPFAGDAWLLVSIQPAQAHDDQGRATVSELVQVPGFPNLKELKLTCDFEAEVAWVLGVATPAPFRVIELRDPLRLVVDVRHR